MPQSRMFRLESKADSDIESNGSFMKVSLPGVRFCAAALSLLNQGAEIAESYKKCFADIAGVPQTKRLRLLRSAE